MDTNVIINNDIKPITDPFDKIINDLKRTRLLLSTISEEISFTDEKLMISTVKDLIQIISNYEANINTISIIKPQMDEKDYEKLSRELKTNVENFKRLLRKIFFVIVDQNNVDYTYKYMEDIMNNEFKYIISDDLLKKNIISDAKGNEIKSDLDNYISNLNDIISTDVKKRQISPIIDIPLDDMPILKKEKNPYEEVIDVEPFVNKPYEESRNKEITTEINDLERYFKRFDILKNRLKEKGKYNSLNVKEVELYNKLESELLNLKENKNSKLIRLKVKFYFNQVEKKLKLSKDNYYKYLIKSKEERKIR